MTRAELRVAAEREGILSTAYSFEGGLPDQTYVLAADAGGWSVYFAERGSREEEARFETEDEACGELFLRLVKDPTTRRY
jgi:hypothetical protein